MDDQFRRLDLGRPLYEYSQIVTEDDLIEICRALQRQYKRTPFYRPLLKWGTGVAIGIIVGLLQWLREGKNAIKTDN